MTRRRLTPDEPPHALRHPDAARPPAPADTPPGARGWLWVASAFAIYAIVAVFVVTQRAESTSDFRDYWRTAAHFRETGVISDELGVHNYLPFFTIFMLPWSLLPLHVAIVGFTLLSLALFAVTVLMGEALLCGGLRAGPRRATLIAVALIMPYVHSCAMLGAVDLLLLFLVVATWFLVERGREWSAGLLLALAALIKLLPALLVVYFVLRGRWRVAAAACGAGVALGAGLPLASVGYDETLRQHAAFYERAVAGHGAHESITTDKPRKAKYTNNSLPIVLRGLLSPTDRNPNDPPTPLFVNVADVPRELIWRAYAAISAALLIVSVIVVPRPGSRAAWAPGATRASFGAWCCLMVLLSPLLWTRYLLLAFWPLVLLAYAADGRAQTARAEGDGGPPRATAESGFLRWAVRGVLLYWLLAAIGLAWPAARAAGVTLGCALLAWAACVWLALRARHYGARVAPARANNSATDG
ncbi:MAG: glycosyltransferase family 87 protein [Phycisphaerae bacterium]